jgi:hypothetical protein
MRLGISAMLVGTVLCLSPRFSRNSLIAAQGIVIGMVRRDSGGPLQGVEVILEQTGRQALTDKAGIFKLTDVPFGPQTLLFRWVGLHPVRRGILVLRGDTVRLDIVMRMDTVQELPSLTVTARPPMGRGLGMRESFEERRKLGFGKFIDSAVLRANEHRRVSDVLRSIPGVWLIWYSDTLSGLRRAVGVGAAREPPELRATTTRRPFGNRGYCWSSVILDGMVLYRSWSPGKPPDWSRDFYVNELEAIEVYRSAAETPSEFGGTVGECGVIVLWSRRGGG